MGDRIQSTIENMATWELPLPKPRWKLKKQSTDPGETLAPLAPNLFNSLGEKVSQLPAPEPCQVAVRQALSEALQNWQANPEAAHNSLVILGKPVEDITAILKASLQAGFEDYTVQFCLSAYQRPVDPLEIPQHIQRELEPKEKTTEKTTPQSSKTAPDEGDNSRPTIVVVPRLEQCFLRCIQGWEGIEYMQNLSTRDTERFWVFGCNHWAWAFLERVCQVSAYLEKTLTLPALSGEALQTWLLPFYSDVITVMNLAAAEDEPIVVFDEDNSIQNYSLSNLSLGIGATAARLWIKSLRVRAKDLEESRAGQTIIRLLSAKPALPSLMALEVMDRYLLHSLLIHGEMTRAHLALSLGEAERKIRSRLQVLRREGIILQRGRRLSVHPAHYPKLYSELKNNNFSIGKE